MPSSLYDLVTRHLSPKCIPIMSRKNHSNKIICAIIQYVFFIFIILNQIQISLPIVPRTSLTFHLYFCKDFEKGGLLIHSNPPEKLPLF